MPRVSVAVVSRNLLMGGYLLAAIGLTTGCHRAYTPTTSNPNDSPVTVRGGSVEGLSQIQWAPYANTPGVWEDAGVATATVSMDGVEPAGSTTAQSVTASSLQTNWTMTLSFRDKKDDNDNTYQLQLCTTYPCSTSGLLSNTLYLVDENNNGKFDSTLNDPAKRSDGFYRLRYDVQKCDDGSLDPRLSRCNHIKQITVTGISFSAGSVPAQGPFACRAGACTIGIGQ